MPSDAEWNYAAAGGAEQRAYPWSKPASDRTIDASFAVKSACDDCAVLVQPPSTSERVIRGGSAYDSASYLNSSVLDVYNPTTRLNYIGFRCARDR